MNARYLTSWVRALRDEKAIDVASVGVAYNEEYFDVGFAKMMRRSLDAANLSHVATIAPDSTGPTMWSIVDAIQSDEEFSESIDVVGTHCPGAINNTTQPPPNAASLLQPLWSTEQHIGETGLVGSRSGYNNKSFDDLPVWDTRAALGIARVINQGYITANQTATLLWTPVYSWYEHLLYAGKGLLVANTPWSGFYAPVDALWMVAHTTQFAQPGWRFADNEGCRLLEDGQGSVVTYYSPDNTDVSVVIETAQSVETNSLVLKVVLDRHIHSLHMWRTEPAKGTIFERQEDLVLAKDGLVRLEIPPGIVLTLTTTTGQSKGTPASAIPAPANFSDILPHHEDFEGVALDRMPRFTSDMHGVFSVNSVPGLGKVLEQRSVLPPVATHSIGARENNYATIIGDASLVDYAVSIDARLCVEGGCCPTAKAGVWPAMIHTRFAPAGFVLRVEFPEQAGRNASWTVQAGKGDCGIGIDCKVVVVQRGEMSWRPGTWKRLSLAARRINGGDHVNLTWSVGSSMQGEATVESFPEARGAAALGSGLKNPRSQWDNLTIKKV